MEEGDFFRNARKLLPLQRNDIGRWHAWHDDRPLSAIFNIKYKPVSKNVYDNKLVALDAWIGFPCGPLILIFPKDQVWAKFYQHRLRWPGAADWSLTSRHFGEIIFSNQGVLYHRQSPVATWMETCISFAGRHACCNS